MTTRVFTTSFDVRFPEVDSYGVVWHGHYVQYFEVARNALCAAFGKLYARGRARARLQGADHEGRADPEAVRGAGRPA